MALQAPNQLKNDIETHTTAAGLEALVNTRLAAILALENWTIVSSGYWSDATNMYWGVVYAYYAAS